MLRKANDRSPDVVSCPGLSVEVERSRSPTGYKERLHVGSNEIRLSWLTLSWGPRRKSWRSGGLSCRLDCPVDAGPVRSTPTSYTRHPFQAGHCMRASEASVECRRAAQHCSGWPGYSSWQQQTDVRPPGKERVETEIHGAEGNGIQCQASKVASDGDLVSPLTFLAHFTSTNWLAMSYISRAVSIWFFTPRPYSPSNIPLDSHRAEGLDMQEIRCAMPPVVFIFRLCSEEAHQRCEACQC